MKIVFCTYDDKSAINGINVWLLNLLPALKAKGFNVSVIYYSWSAENECSTIPLLKDLGIECYRISSKRYLEQEVKWILNQVKILQPDIFVANHILQAWYAAPWIEKAGIPTIGVIHNDDIEYNLLIDSFLGNKHTGMTACVAVSAKLYKNLLSNCVNLNIKQIPCGTPVFAEKAFLNRGTSFNIFYVGRLANKQKNISLVSATLVQTIEKIINVEAFIYGSGPDYNDVIEIINRSTQPNQIKLKGIVNNDVIRKDILNAHAIILMSDYEGLPVAIMEAMAAGVVPICKETESGLSELVIDNHTGLFIKNSSDFIHKIEYLQNNPQEWERLSTNAKLHIERNFGLPKVVEDWIRLFEEIKSKNKLELQIPRKIRLPKNEINSILGEHREPSLIKKMKSKLISIYKNA
ncbi:MAG: glycosyltransferase [Pedobacter sp.]|nr:MAG: glycosyltransferase [Pedobacter sp.]